jgi:hypothetical protein
MRVPPKSNASCSWVSPLFQRTTSVVPCVPRVVWGAVVLVNLPVTRQNLLLPDSNLSWSRTTFTEMMLGFRSKYQAILVQSCRVKLFAWPDWSTKFCVIFLESYGLLLAFQSSDTLTTGLNLEKYTRLQSNDQELGVTTALHWSMRAETAA